jgi:hypothetical protein
MSFHFQVLFMKLLMSGMMRADIAIKATTPTAIWFMVSVSVG